MKQVELFHLRVENNTKKKVTDRSRHITLSFVESYIHVDAADVTGQYSQLHFSKWLLQKLLKEDYGFECEKYFMKAATFSEWLCVNTDTICSYCSISSLLRFFMSHLDSIYNISNRRVTRSFYFQFILVFHTSKL